MNPHYEIEEQSSCTVLRLVSEDGTNRLSRARVIALTSAVETLASAANRLILAGNRRFFSVGADLEEIQSLRGHDAFAFAEMGQKLMRTIADFPAPTCAVIEGWCMGGGFDLALACRFRVAGPHAIFGHRGAALGLMTGWGGTQRLPRLIGRAAAMEIFLTAEKVHARRARELGVVDSVCDDVMSEAVRMVSRGSESQR